MSASTILAPERPFLLSDEGTTIVLTLLPAAGLHCQLAYEDSVVWAGPSRGSDLIVDWASQPRGSAMLTAWLVHLIQVLRPPRLTLRHASPAVRESLTRYHLSDHLRLHGGEMILES